VHQVGEQEVQRPQPQDRERVGGEHQERLAGHREDRRDRVDREHDVARLDEHQHRQQGSGHQPPVDARDELLPVVGVRAGHEPPEQAEHHVVRQVDVLEAMPEHAVAGEHQERPEHVQHPAEPVDESRAAGDEQRPEHQRPEDAVEQHPVLQFAGNGEVTEDQREHEHVVDGQRLLDEVAGQVLAAGLRAVHRPDDGPETQTQRHPDGRPDGGLAHRHDVRAAVGEQIHGEHAEDDDEDGDPRPQGHIHDSLQRTRSPRRSLQPPGRPARRAGLRAGPSCRRNCWGYSPRVPPIMAGLSKLCQGCAGCRSGWRPGPGQRRPKQGNAPPAQRPPVEG